MALFHTDSLSLACANVQVEKQWWMATFDCKETKIPVDWDDPLPSDVALKLPGADRSTILLSDKTEGGLDRQDGHPIVFCANLKKAYEYVRARVPVIGPIQEGGGTKFFEIRDPEGNVIEICETP